jgi:hypothetical protein
MTVAAPGADPYFFEVAPVRESCTAALKPFLIVAGEAF